VPPALSEALASWRVAHELDELFRQAAESLIVTNAHRVNRGELGVAALNAALRAVLNPEGPELALGSRRALRRAVDNATPRQRNSLLAEELKRRAANSSR